uniref:Peroxisomal biosis factor 13 n=1 Tax=Saimiri boliviensis boliviensis TaxID=39432 RepID=A0A2K6TJ72_SAIBB
MASQPPPPPKPWETRRIPGTGPGPGPGPTFQHFDTMASLSLKGICPDKAPTGSKVSR